MVKVGWFCCVSQIYTHNRQDITETNLKPALLDGEDGPDQLLQPSEGRIFPW